MLLVADAAAQAAAVFTTNKVDRGAVSVSKDHLQRSGGSVARSSSNSGCANGLHRRFRARRTLAK